MSEKKETIKVQGMSCAACSARIEKELGKDGGVKEAYANFSNNTVSVTYDDESTDREKIESLIEKAGYEIAGNGIEVDRSSDLRISLIMSIVFSLPVVVLSMGPMMGIDVGVDMRTSAILQTVLSTAVIVFGRRFFMRGIPALITRSPTMDTLVALGSGAAYAYSAALTVSILSGGEAVHLYYESAVMILTLISVGKFLESRSRERTNDAVNGLRDLAPKEVRVIRGGIETMIPASELEVGDVIQVRPGERIFADAVVTDGRSSVNESMLTGENMPVTKSVGDSIFGGTLNSNGTVTARVTAVGDDSTLSRIIRMIEDAQSTKAPIARVADRVASKFVPAVILLALASCTGWYLAGKGTAFSLTVMISVLVISCPCALGLATPLAIIVGTGKGAQHGILFKDASSLEYAGRIDTVILDKTGTITEGVPSVDSVHPVDRAYEILGFACSAEQRSEHPIGKAIVSYGAKRGIVVSDAEDYEFVTGMGIRCVIRDHTVLVGNEAFVGGAPAFSDRAASFAGEGATVVFVSVDDEVIGLISVSDTIRDGSPSAIASLGSMGISVKMVTGDNKITADAVASKVGIVDVVAGARPEDKMDVVKRLQAEQHNVAMAGDGINDAPALTQSDLGMSVSSGTDIAMDSSDVVLMNDDIRNIPAALEIGRATLRNVKQNLFFAFCYNVVCIPIAAGLPYLYGMALIHEMPMIAAAAMSLSSLSVVTNALRLRTFRPRSIGPAS